MQKLLPLFPKPSRYLGIEEGSVLKNAADISFRVGLAFPDLYEVGMSYLGQKILYSLVNERPTWWAERVFAPCLETAAILKSHDAPLCTLESDTPLKKLDALGFSVTHELCYTNCLYILDLSGIPLRSKDRAGPGPDGRPWPWVIAGGGCTLSAEPLAPFMDLMILGEGEEVFPELLSLLEQGAANGWARAKVLVEASRIPGVYVPEFFDQDADIGPNGAIVKPLVPDYPKAVRRVIPDLNDQAYPERQVIPFGAIHNRLALEIGRGCTRGCRFCQAGNLYRPARERAPENLRKTLETCLQVTGYDDVSFLSLSTGDYSALKELFMSTVDRCAREQISVSLPSLRVGSIDDAIMERMSGIRRTGATLAPEAGSQRLRDVINKGITEEELILHVQKLFEHGWQQVKLYFMIGLPTETDEDLEGIVDLCRKARDAAGPGIKRMQITAAISPFVPKPHTPFQWEGQLPVEEIRRRIGFLLEAFKKEKRIKMRWHEPSMSALEGLFSRGDRRLADVVETAFRKGAVFPDWYENFSLAPWLEALDQHGLAIEEYTGARNPDIPLPWDHLHSGLSRDFLLRERSRAVDRKTSPDCRYGPCNGCGVCDIGGRESLLQRLPGQETGNYTNVLNNSQRDQEKHSVRLDQYGRVVVRNGIHPDSSPGAPKNKPAGVAAHLAVKAAQIRFRYSRSGNAAFLSQLELQNIFDRALRRAALPLAFSQGFHPLPLVSFGRALPVGVCSESEWFSVYLRESIPLEPVVSAMNAWLPRGVSISSVERLPLPKFNADQDSETYRMDFLGELPNLPKFVRAWTKISDSKYIPWQKESKKGIRELDARSYFAGISCEEHSCILQLDWTNGYVSPLSLCSHVLAFAGFEANVLDLRLTKTG